MRESERGEESVIFFCQGFNRGIETLTGYFVNQIQVKKKPVKRLDLVGLIGLNRGILDISHRFC